VEQLQGPGTNILKENIGALKFLLEHYSTVADLDYDLNE
jgi:hypothetical protein